MYFNFTDINIDDDSDIVKVIREKHSNRKAQNESELTIPKVHNPTLTRHHLLCLHKKTGLREGRSPYAIEAS